MSYCPDCHSSAYCPGLPCKACGAEAHATLQRDRSEAREAGLIHPVDISFKVRETPGFGVVPLGFKR